MGGGSWSDATYAARTAADKAAGRSAFHYSDTVKRTGDLKVHKSLDPKGVTLRESRDSKEHPNSTPITVLFDVTGSMHQFPHIIQGALPKLLGLLTRKGYVTDPQIQFGAIGDAYSDQVPFQIGQWESDNRLDTDLGNIVLEGNGGANAGESYELAMWFMDHHTETDAALNGRNAYLFIIGDEPAYEEVRRETIERVLGGGMEVDSIKTRDVLESLQDKYQVFFLIPPTRSGLSSRTQNFWSDLLGENVINVTDGELIPEIIAVKVGLLEGNLDFAQVEEDLKEFGVKNVSAVRESLGS